MRLFLSCLLCLVVWLVPGPRVLAQTDCAHGHALDDQALQTLDFEAYRRKEERQKPLPRLTDTYRLGTVRYFRQNVFPDRAYWLARQANRLKRVTREKALRHAFSMDVGDLVDEAQRAEAERILRNKPYLYDALVLVRRVCADVVDLDVVVRDVWTLTPGIALSRSGGENETSASLSDVNALGSGKGVTIAYFDDQDRAGTLLEIIDPNVAGSRWQAALLAADNDDGARYRLTVERPFYALDTQVSMGVSAAHFMRDQDLEFLGDDVYEIEAESDVFSVYGARSSGRRDGWVHRKYIGYRFVDEAFEFPQDFPGETRVERRFAYPFLAWQALEDRFEKSADIQRIGITEDIKLGWSFYAELGWSSDDSGGEGDHLLGRGQMTYREFIGSNQLFSAHVQASGRYNLDERQRDDIDLQAELAYLWQQGDQWRFFVSSRYRQTHNLAPEKQLTLGGDSGLRGYPTRYQPGDRSFQLTLEQRYHSSAYPFGLFRIGYAAFVDVGRAWFDDHAPDWVPRRQGDHFGMLSNVGIGLRLESTRTRRDRVLHVDLSRPLVDGPDVENWELTVTARQQF